MCYLSEGFLHFPEYPSVAALHFTPGNFVFNQVCIRFNKLYEIMLSVVGLKAQGNCGVKLV